MTLYKNNKNWLMLTPSLGLTSMRRYCIDQVYFILPAPGSKSKIHDSCIMVHYGSQLNVPLSIAGAQKPSIPWVTTQKALIIPMPWNLENYPIILNIFLKPYIYTTNHLAYNSHFHLQLPNGQATLFIIGKISVLLSLMIHEIGLVTLSRYKSKCILQTCIFHAIYCTYYKDPALTLTKPEIHHRANHKWRQECLTPTPSL